MRVNMMPTVGSTQSDNQSALNDLKGDAQDLLRAAKQKIEMDSVGSVLEKVAGGSGKEKTSSDLEGIASLVTALTGGANQAMMGANSLLLGLLNQKKENGNTQEDWLDKLIKFAALQKLFAPQTPMDSSAQWVAFFTAFMEQDRKHQTALMDLMNQFHSQRYQDLQERSGPDPLTSQLYNQWLPTIVHQSIGVANKDPVDHLLESADKLKKLSSLGGIFGNTTGTVADQIQMKTLGLKENEIFSNERIRMAEINSGHKKWKHIGNTLGAIFGDGSGGNPLLNFANMAQGLAGAGQPGPGMPGQGAMA